MVDSAGAMIVETMMRLNPVADRTSVTAHLRLAVQSLEFSLSHGWANVTSSVSGVKVVMLSELGSWRE
ncbi:hypothetical protein NUU61_001811 [Penicillium alfredii]|uniref:Uncharacterized protein n=1 Tax=Penicillium alfredii TaxID=1506179 RepID=A0A9W9FQJ5_9EURO|nr:uncharacterized protein NUU61_001811 [Penicillium alfredii]KAJ5104464.1 hypothetical protein NUU61_001811 [Penicillium alfredii]